MAMDKYDVTDITKHLTPISTDETIPTVLKIYPNPMKSQANIIIVSHEVPVKLYIYDTYGREVAAIEGNSDSITLHRDNLGPGMYKLALESHQGTFFQKQILVVE
jgi:type IX secretion system substrate protein